MNPFICLISLLISAATLKAVEREQSNLLHLNALIQQGVSQESIIRADSKGVPKVCGTGLQVSPDTKSTFDLLPAGIRGWECIPNVIRNDGIDTFRLEVDVNRPVNDVIWSGLWEYYFVSESGANALYLRDDGLNGDRIAGDFIYTSEPCRYRAEIPMAPNQRFSTNSPAGIYITEIGQLSDDAGSFLISPAMAVLNTNVPAVETALLASNVQVSAHLINVATTNRDAQKFLRLGNGLTPVTKTIYNVLPDAFDFLAFFSTDHLENTNRLASANFVAGRFIPASVNYTGTGRSTFDNSSLYGSGGRLMGVPVFDIMERGIDSSINAAHEISHQWSAFVTTGLNITTGDGHYHRNCSINSIIGGLYKPVTNGSGGIVRDCNAFDVFEATPLDRYMMGLISTSAVPPLFVSSNILQIACGSVITNLRPMVTISNIVAAHGVRTPGPTNSKKDFRIGFVAGSHNRLLNATEMTFYDLMAAHFTKALPPEIAPPNLADGWIPITRFFGETTTWNSDVLNLIRPTITSAEMSSNGVFRLDGTGYPGKNYRLLVTTNFLNWTSLATNTTSSNGSFSFLHNVYPTNFANFYRVTTP